MARISEKVSISLRQQSVTPGAGRRQRRTRPRAPARFQPGRSGAWNAPLPSIRSRGCTRLGESNWSCSAVARAAASHELAGSCKQRDPERATEVPCKVARTATHVSATAIMFHVFMMVQHGSWSAAPRARRWPSLSQDDSARAARRVRWLAERHSHASCAQRRLSQGSATTCGPVGVP